MPHAKVRQSQIFYDWVGPPAPGPTLILLDGLSSDSRANSELFKPLSGRFPMLVVDVSNRGQSSSTGSPIPLSRQVEEVAAAVSAAGVKEPVWHSSSSRAALAYRLALAHPTRGMILESPVFSYKVEPLLKLFHEIADYTLEDESLYRYMQFMCLFVISAQAMSKDKFLFQSRLMRMRRLFTAQQLKMNLNQGLMSEPDDIEAIRSIRCPIFVMHGKHDLLVSPSLVEETLQGTNFEMRVLDAGHSVMIECLNLVFEGISEFMGRLRALEGVAA